MALVFLAAAAAPVAADGEIPIKVIVGKSVATDVGFARGSYCDDTDIARAEMREKTAETNSFVVTGVKVGTTLCRAGSATDLGRPSYVYKVTVVAAVASQRKTPSPSK